jgi:hypothetical protein
MVQGKDFADEFLGNYSYITIKEMGSFAKLFKVIREPAGE